MNGRSEFRGLDYPDRHKLAVQLGLQLTVYVLLGDQEKMDADNRWLAPQSGIVGETVAFLSPDLVWCHYEGWVNGAMQYADLDDRGRWEAAVYHAAGRAFVEYPTVARRAIPRMFLRPVGFIRAGDRTPTVTDEAAVERWLNGRSTPGGPTRPAGSLSPEQEGDQA